MWQFDASRGIGHWALGIAGLRRNTRSDCRRAAMPNPPNAQCPMPNASNKKSRIKMRDDQTLTVLPSPAGEPEDGNS